MGFINHFIFTISTFIDYLEFISNEDDKKVIDNSDIFELSSQYMYCLVLPMNVAFETADRIRLKRLNNINVTTLLKGVAMLKDGVFASKILGFDNELIQYFILCDYDPLRNTSEQITYILHKKFNDA